MASKSGDFTAEFVCLYALLMPRVQLSTELVHGRAKVVSALRHNGLRDSGLLTVGSYIDNKAHLTWEMGYFTVLHVRFGAKFGDLHAKDSSSFCTQQMTKRFNLAKTHF